MRLSCNHARLDGDAVRRFRSAHPTDREMGVPDDYKAL